MTWPTYALFTDESEADDLDGFLVRRVKVFECGDYTATHNFSLTPPEALAAVASFSPVDLEVQHTDTVLDGICGKLLTLVPQDGGRVLVGDVAIPRWLAHGLRQKRVEVSAAWDRATKRLHKLGLVIRGHIPDAVLKEAYAQFEGRRNSTDDQARIQQMHDLASQLGASCGTGTASAGPLWAAFTVGGNP